MISVDEVRKYLSESAWLPSRERIALEDSFGRVLATDYKTDRNLPPFDRITMDGIAIPSSSYKQGIRSFRCENTQFAGAAQVTHSGRPDTCIEVATGAVVPYGCDAVIPYEWLEKKEGAFRVVHSGTVQSGVNIHSEGSDLTAATTVLSKNQVIDHHAITILASIGVAQPEVWTMPKTAVISTGDELVDFDRTPLPHQIRKSNDLVISGLLSPLGVHAERIHLPDSQEQLSVWLQDHMTQYDLLIFSGGVSMGRKDFTPDVLAEAGIQPIFHKVKQRPGKPLWFGKSEKLTVFGLPGNPVSAAVSTAVHIRYWLTHFMASELKETSVVLDEAIQFKPQLTRWMPVISYCEHGVIKVKPVPGNNSGDFISLYGTSGLIELPAEQNEFERGSVYNYINWEWKINSLI